MNNKKTGPQMIPMAQFVRIKPAQCAPQAKKPVLPTPSKMYQGKAKNGLIIPRKPQ